MSKKNKLLIAAAVIAVLLLVASGVARCSLAQKDEPPEEPAIEAKAEQAEEQAAVEIEEVQAESAPDEASGLEALVGTSWTADDGSPATLSILMGAFVEMTEGQTSVTYWTIDSEEEGDAGITSVILASKSPAEAAAPTVVTISRDGGATVIKSDALAHPYKQVQTNARALSFSGVTGDLEEAMGADIAKIEAAVSERAAAVSPSATRAVWDGEAWIDYANDMATTTFTLEDGAATMVSVTRKADGTIEAL
ncbi:MULTISPECIES: hypothetical protein [unclassified Adlercreutzia]|uniref:hypothetical protein n=1 Tax=unclassified Adlercreutzia TaxID=2636013 RepID=UPI0013E9EA23|nr:MULTISPECIES: hypothetical protein [unclassified Adlercreutzia]